MYRAAIPPIQRALWLRRKFWDAPKALSLCYCASRKEFSFQQQDLPNIEQSSPLDSIDSIPQKELLLKLQSIRTSYSGAPLLRLERANTLIKEAEANGVDILCYHYGVALGICADGGLLKQALSIIKAIKNLGRQPHSSNYLNAIVAAGKVSMLYFGVAGRAIDVLLRLELSITYHCLLLLMCDNRYARPTLHFSYYKRQSRLIRRATPLLPCIVQR